MPATQGIESIEAAIELEVRRRMDDRMGAIRDALRQALALVDGQGAPSTAKPRGGSKRPGPGEVSLPEAIDDMFAAAPTKLFTVKEILDHISNPSSRVMGSPTLVSVRTTLERAIKKKKRPWRRVRRVNTVRYGRNLEVP